MPRQLTPQQKQAAQARIAQMQARGELSRDPEIARQQLASLAKHNQAIRNAQNEAIDWARSLAPQAIQFIGNKLALHGPDAILRDLRAAGMSQAAVEVLAQTYREHGGWQGTVAALDQAAIRRINDIAVGESVSRWTATDGDGATEAALKRNSPLAARLRDPDQQRMWAEIYAEAGKSPAPGLSAMEDFFTELSHLTSNGDDGLLMNATRRIGESKVDQAEQVRLYAETIGIPHKIVRDAIAEFEGHQASHALTARLAERDAREAKRKVIPEASPASVAQSGSSDRLRSTLERAYDAASEPRKTPGTVVRERVEARRQAPETDRRSASERRREALERGFDHLEQTGERPEATPSEPAGDSRHEALSEAYDAIDSGELATEGA